MGIFLHLPKQNLSKANRNTTNPAARDVPIYPQKSFWTPYVLFWNFYDLPYQSISYLYCNIYHITVKHNQWYIILNQTTSVFFTYFFISFFASHIVFVIHDPVVSQDVSQQRLLRPDQDGVVGLTETGPEVGVRNLSISPHETGCSYQLRLLIQEIRI